MKPAELFIDRLASGLKRKAVTDPSRWALNYRVMGKPFPGKWSFTKHPWLREMHDSKAPHNVGQKSAQVGYSEWALNIALYNIDIRQENVLYILPNKTPDATDFSTSRFDPALELSEHLSSLFTDVKNVGMKRAGAATLFIRGSQSRSGLKSIPAGHIIFDEYDEMNQDNLDLAETRQDGQVDKTTLKISTPTTPEQGINKLFLASTQEHYHFRCPHCSKFIEMKFPDSLIIVGDDPNSKSLHKCHYICYECKAPLTQEEKAAALQTGIWIPSILINENSSNVRGFYINQMYSPTISPAELAKAYLRSLYSKPAEQEFHNSKMGMPHVVSGGQVDDTQFNECIGNYQEVHGLLTPKLTTMGVDVGSWLHYEIDEWFLGPDFLTDPNISATVKVLKYGKVRSFDELVKIMYDFQIGFCIVDANPERRKALEFAHKIPGKVQLCIYGSNINGLPIANSSIDKIITVDRTAWLDQSLGRFMNGTIELPASVDLEYRRHIKAQTRHYEFDKNNNPVSHFKTAPGIEDHYGHARNYAEIALRFALGMGPNRNIANPV